MAENPRKGPSPMPATQPNHESLQQVHELNRLFLTHLHLRLRTDHDCCGLPDVARGPLRRATAESIAAIAVFPRALFDLRLEERPSPVRDPLRSRDDGAEHALGLTILLCAWTLSRQSTYQARLLLGLDARSIQRLRALQLGDLPVLAHSRELVLCAFAGRDWIWSELVKDTRPEARQHLALIALQPGLGRDWPARRAGRVSL
jgi:hypothetical protein